MSSRNPADAARSPLSPAPPSSPGAGSSWDVSRLTPNRLRVYVTVVERQSIRAAARELALSEVAVRQNLSELTDVTGGTSLLSRGGQDGRLVVPTVHGRRVYAAAGAILAQAEALARLGSSLHVLAFHPQHAGLVAPAWRAAGMPENVELLLLAEDEGGRRPGEERALRQVEDGLLDIVVGSPARVADNPGLRTERLFTARLEALLPPGDDAVSVEVAALAGRRLLLPPWGVRGRQILETAFAERGSVTPHVVLESADEGALEEFARHGAGTVVLGSDMTAPFARLAEREGFRWAPVVDGGSELGYPVSVTTRTEAGPVVDALRRRLHEAAAQLRCARRSDG
ncbi:LysR family transcriptional regulator [Motilibacter aurantiacus]|uniref:LysR family transcriptional regulator n=1 Tax=Motilibacter aurantiacus TaxID=2714955 RepID=UPI00140C6C0B|nr:LysR family transcriptional regulator [Motilibacter aurantiacus]